MVRGAVGPALQQPPAMPSSDGGTASGNDVSSSGAGCCRGRCRPSQVEGLLARVFASYGRWAAHHPYLLVFGSLAVCAYLSLGLKHVHFITDADDLYMPQGSQAHQDRDWIKERYPDLTLSNYYPHQLPTFGLFVQVIGRAKDRDTVLRPEILDELQSLISYVHNVTALFKGKTVTYQDVCAKRDGDCAAQGEYLVSASFRKILAENGVTYPTIEDPYQLVPPRVDDMLGEVDVRKGKVHRAGYFLVHLQLVDGTPELKNRSRAWENAFIVGMKEFKGEGLEVAFASSQSISQELESTIGADIIFFVLTIGLMVVYASVVSTGRDCVSSRGTLAKAGVLATVLSLPAACGCLLAHGVSMVQIIGVMPFLVIGFGIDDMFVLLSGLAGSRGMGTLEERMAFTLSSSGLSITITTLTDVIAFFVGALSNFLSVTNFCIYTGMAILVCYLMMITFFVGCMVLHERRVDASRHDVTCMRTQTAWEARKAGRNPLYVLCCTGSPPRDRKEAESWLERVPPRLLSSFLLKAPVRVASFVGCLCSLGVACWAVTQFQQGLQLRNLVSDSSYYHRFSVWQEDHFRLGEAVSFVLTEPVPYWQPDVQDKLSAMLTRARQDPDVLDDLKISWLDAYKESFFYNDTSREVFLYNLQTFFLPVFTVFSNDVVFSEDGASINSSRLYVRCVGLSQYTAKADFMLRMREIANTAELPVFAFAAPFFFYEQAVAIVPNTIQTVGVSVAAVFLVTAIFLPSLLLVLYVTLAVTAIMVSLFGFMHLWGLTLSSVTMVHVIMSVGFSVDYTAHICHAYHISSGDTRTERVRGALEKVGGPILHGGLSSIVGILLLIFSQSYIFRSFFQIMLLVILLGLQQSFLLLPCVLSVVGPMPKADPPDSQAASEAGSLPEKDNRPPSLDPPKPNIFAIHDHFRRRSHDQSLVTEAGPSNFNLNFLKSSTGSYVIQPWESDSSAKEKQDFRTSISDGPPRCREKTPTDSTPSGSKVTLSESSAPPMISFRQGGSGHGDLGDFNPFVPSIPDVHGSTDHLIPVPDRGVRLNPLKLKTLLSGSPGSTGMRAAHSAPDITDDEGYDRYGGSGQWPFSRTQRVNEYGDDVRAGAREGPRLPRPPTYSDLDRKQRMAHARELGSELKSFFRRPHPHRHLVEEPYDWDDDQSLPDLRRHRYRTGDDLSDDDGDDKVFRASRLRLRPPGTDDVSVTRARRSDGSLYDKYDGADDDDNDDEDDESGWIHFDADGGWRRDDAKMEVETRFQKTPRFHSDREGRFSRERTRPGKGGNPVGFPRRATIAALDDYVTAHDDVTKNPRDRANERRRRSLDGRNLPSGRFRDRFSFEPSPRLREETLEEGGEELEERGEESAHDGQGKGVSRGHVTRW